MLWWSFHKPLIVGLSVVFKEAVEMKGSLSLHNLFIQINRSCISWFAKESQDTFTESGAINAPLWKPEPQSDHPCCNMEWHTCLICKNLGKSVTFYISEKYFLKHFQTWLACTDMRCIYLKGRWCFIMPCESSILDETELSWSNKLLLFNYGRPSTICYFLDQSDLDSALGLLSN